MALGLAKKNVPIFVDGGIDTKTNPKLVRGPALLELENMYQLKTGELRVRNGFAALPQSLTSTGGISALFPLMDGVGSINTLRAGTVPRAPTVYLSAGGAATAGWYLPLYYAQSSGAPLPLISSEVTAIEAKDPEWTTSPPDLVNPDACALSGLLAVTWSMPQDAGGAFTIYPRGHLMGLARRQSINTGMQPIPGVSVQRPPVTAAAGGKYCQFYVDTGAPGTLRVDVYDSGGFVTTTVISAAGVSAAQPWVDVKVVPGGTLIAVAFRATAGGVTCCLFNPATGAITSSVTTAGADASMTLGWLDDSLTTGNMYLATAGSGSGVVVRTMSATTMVVSATNVIDATATANIRNITGHLNTSATNYKVLWDVANATTYLDKTVQAQWTGAASVIDFAYGFSVYSRSFQASDGKYYWIGAYDSTTQPVFAVFQADRYGPNTIDRGAQVQGIILPGSAGGRRTVACSIASAFADSGSIYVPLSKRTKLTTANGDVLQLRGIVLAKLAINSTQLTRPRELGGTVFLPGGVITAYDGHLLQWATTPIYPESPTLVSSATGSMTASGAYNYRLVWYRKDGTGRLIRSAPSVPAAITLGAGDGRVTLTFQDPPLVPMGREWYVVEIYRAGPGAAGDTGYNKVGEKLGTGTGGTITFIDSMSDATSELGETLYTTGNVLDNFVSPSCRLLEVNGNRVGIVNAEDPTEFWPSKEYKPGGGLGFTPLGIVRVTGDGFGAITAVASMDGRWILFKSSAIYVVSGDGPNDNGQGSFSNPQAISRSIGTVIPSSVVETPDGLMFQAAAGMYLLDRGLGLTYIGAPVEQYTLAENVVDGSLVTGQTQVRFVQASGRCLVWDYHHKRWYTYLLRVVDILGATSTITACANTSLGWCYALATGYVMQEVAGSTVDVSNTTVSITPRISFPHLDFAGLAGYQRFRGLEITVDVVGNHTLSMDAEYDYSGAVTGTPRTKALTTATPTVQVEYNPPEGKAKCTAVRPVLTISGAALNGSFRLTGVTAVIGVKRGTNVPPTSRLT